MRVTVGAAVLISACGWPVDPSAVLPDGVAVAAFSDRSGESEAAQFHDVPVLLVRDDGVRQGLEEAKVVRLHAAKFVVVDFDPCESA
jgi:hypothetical protein